MPRLFYALWPDDAARAQLADAAAAVDVRDGRRIRSENLHLTLAFLGSVAPECCARLEQDEFPADLPEITLEITACGWWRATRVAWLAPLETPPALLQLRAAVLAATRAAGLDLERGKYAPHVTVARRVRRAPRTTGRIASRWRVSDFALIESHAEALGARYEVLRRWPLAALGSD